MHLKPDFICDLDTYADFTYEPPNSLREAIICEIRILQFDRDDDKKKALGAITNIIRYKELLAKRFKQRYLALFA